MPSSPERRLPAAVLFDMDGTLVDTEWMWQQAEHDTMRHFGSDWTAEDKKNAIGGPYERVVSYMAQRTGADYDLLGEDLASRILHLMSAEPIEVHAGALHIHQQAIQAGLPTALVSNSWRRWVDTVLAGIDIQFDVTVAGDEGEPKPSPQPYLTACELLAVNPTDCVVLEDSPTGVASATAAGCAVVVIGSTDEFSEAEHRMVVPNLDGLTLSDFSILLG